MKTKTKGINKKLLRKYGIIILLAALIGYCSFSLINNYADISRLKTQTRQAEVQYQQQINENEKAKAILNSKNKDAYIEQKAREKGYAKDGETVFYDISSSK